jgi:hypothetical protein
MRTSEMEDKPELSVAGPRPREGADRGQRQGLNITVVGLPWPAALRAGQLAPDIDTLPATCPTNLRSFIETLRQKQPADTKPLTVRNARSVAGTGDAAAV